MNQQHIKLSSKFKKSLYLSIASISLFISTYILLFFISLALVIGAFALTISMLSRVLSMSGLVICGGIIIAAALVFVYVVKFFFKRKNNTHENFIEIKKEQYPKLFELVDSISKEVKTQKPKKIYLSNEVNAGVFYNSTFLSLFLPIKKNLMIGYPLLTTLSQDELTAILTHEFGHFSQNSMRVGSYIYFANNIIHDMLYDDNLDNPLTGFAGYFAFISVGIIRGIQILLELIYRVVNMNYLSLSREMEFQADAIAANLVGSNTLISALQKLEKGTVCYNETLSRVDTIYKKKKNLPSNFFACYNYLYNDQTNGRQINKISRLRFEDKWSSHPNTNERILALTKLNILDKRFLEDLDLNTFLESTIENLSKNVCQVLDVKFNNMTLSLEDFIEDYKSDNTSELPYNMSYYYNNLGLLNFDVEDEIGKTSTIQNNEELFDENILDLVDNYLVLVEDHSNLYDIKTKALEAKNIFYDDKKYKFEDLEALQKQLTKRTEDEYEVLKAHEIQIFRYNYQKAKLLGETDLIVKMYNVYFEINNLAKSMYDQAEDINYRLYLMGQKKDGNAAMQYYSTEYTKSEALFVQNINATLNNSMLALTEDDISNLKYFLEKAEHSFNHKFEDNSYIQSMYESRDIIFRVYYELNSTTIKKLLQYLLKLHESH